MAIFPKGLTHGLCPKMAIFPTFFFAIIGQENVFYDIPERKNAFLGYKKKKFKKSIMAIFPKGLTHGLCSKMAIFPTFFLGNISQENVLYDILERKMAFVGYKNKKFKKSKKGHFSKGVNPILLFSQYRPGKCLLWYSRK